MEVHVLVTLVILDLAVLLSRNLNSCRTYMLAECKSFLDCHIVLFYTLRGKKRNENDKRRYSLARESCRVRIESGIRVRRNEGRIRDV